jgi:predicted transposase YbfD/YdcC
MLNISITTNENRVLFWLYRTILHCVFRHFHSKIHDPRQLWKTRHPLYEIIAICIIAIICGATSSTNIYQFAKIREQWLRKFMPLKNGIPSRLTIERMLRSLNPRVFEEWFNIIMQKVAKETKGAIVAIDGKRFYNQPSKNGKGIPLYIVSAWCTRNGMTLAQQKTKDKSNEITTIPLLLKCLKIPSSIVTIDAIGCQRDIVSAIVKQNKADYCIALKENQPLLYKEMRAYALDCLSDSSQSDKYKTIIRHNKGHGRIEKRVIRLFTDVSWFQDLKKWEGLSGLVMIESTRTIKGVSKTDVRYYITSLTDVEQAADAVRSHWGIENNLHWVLDVVFKEDQWATRKENAAANLAVIRKLSMAFLRKSDVVLRGNQPMSGPMKMFSCALDIKVLEQVLLHSNVFS